MKRLLSEGLERIYQICKSFRDETPSGFHNPEFTMLEWYRAYSDYNEIASDTEALITHVVRQTTGSTKLTFRDRMIDLSTWERITVREVAIVAQVQLLHDATRIFQRVHHPRQFRVAHVAC